MICESLKDIRKKFIPEYYTHQPNKHKFIQLMTTSSESLIRKCALFLFFSNKHRNEMLNIESVNE